MYLSFVHLIRKPISLDGGWVRRWNRNLWEGKLLCDEPFVVLLFVRSDNELLWAKSLPSKDNALELKLDLHPVSKTEPRFQLMFWCGTGAFINDVTAKFAEPEHILAIEVPEIIETASVVRLTDLEPDHATNFNFVCFAKSDVVVRRHYVWGLKPRLLTELEQPWRDILTKGRSGKISYTQEVQC